MPATLTHKTTNDGLSSKEPDLTATPSTTQISDDALVAKFVAGDKLAFTRLVNRYKQKIHTYIYFQINQKASDAEDLTQEVFLALYRQAANFKGEAKFSTFLYAIAHNIVLNYFRTNRRRYADQTDSISQMDEPETRNPAISRALVDNDCPAEQTITQNLQQKIASAINKLSTDDRQLLLLTDREGFSYEQISQILSIKTGTVRSRLNTARTRLLGLIKVNDHEMQ